MPPHLELVVHDLFLYWSASCLKARAFDITETFVSPWTVSGTWYLVGDRCQLIEGIHLTPELAWVESELLFFEPS